MHVTRQHHQLGALGLDDLVLLGFHLLFGGSGHREVVKGHVVAGRQLVKLTVVADDGANVQRQQTTFPAKQQVIQAVAFFADHDHGAHRLGGGVKVPFHAKSLGKFAPLRCQRRAIGPSTGELNAHEKQTCVVVVVLGRFFNIAPMLEQKARHGVHDAGSVGARQGQDVGRGHG